MGLLFGLGILDHLQDLNINEIVRVLQLPELGKASAMHGLVGKFSKYFIHPDPTACHSFGRSHEIDAAAISGIQISAWEELDLDFFQIADVKLCAQNALAFLALLPCHGRQVPSPDLRVREDLQNLDMDGLASCTRHEIRPPVPFGQRTCTHCAFLLIEPQPSVHSNVWGPTQKQAAMVVLRRCSSSGIEVHTQPWNGHKAEFLARQLLIPRKVLVQPRDVPRPNFVVARHAQYLNKNSAVGVLREGEIGPAPAFTQALALEDPLGFVHPNSYIEKRSGRTSQINAALPLGGSGIPHWIKIQVKAFHAAQPKLL
mmetsp:Transcript_8790/g.22131  ORF Transcript_8790/g.22131 Transcript_8790/m.22131 type:complete len:314 (-) Transcript_8790:749-1690(-)